MKKIAFFALGLALVAGLAISCTASKPKVAGVVFQEDQFMKLLQAGYQDAAVKAGYDFIPVNTNNDQAKEAETINTAVTQKYKGIAITTTNEEAAAKTLADASTKGLLVAISNAKIDTFPFATGAYTSDNYTLGKAVGEYAANYIKTKMGGSANIAILEFKTQVPGQSADRVNGFKDQFKGMANVHFIDDQDAWLQDKAITVVSDLITRHAGKLNVVFAANEGGTIGATMGVKNAGQAGKIVTFGFDGSEQMVDLLKDPANILQAAIAQDPYGIGQQTMDNLIAHIKDPNTAKAGTVIIPGILLARDDTKGLDDFLTDLQSKMGKK